MEPKILRSNRTCDQSTSLITVEICQYINMEPRIFGLTEGAIEVASVRQQHPLIQPKPLGVTTLSPMAIGNLGR